MTHDNLNVFQGESSIRDFLNPDLAPVTPLVELPDSLNPYRKNGVRIFAKLMQALPLGNIKSLPAHQMLEDADLSGITTIIENSSGNTAASLAVLGKAFGVPTTKAIVSHEVSEGKLKLLRLMGVEARVNRESICPDPNDTASGIYQARELGTQKGWLNPGQYENTANPKAHARWTGPQIWKQTKGTLDIFCAGCGTTGTLVGTSSYLRQQKKDIHIVGVTRAANNPIPGVRTKNLLRDIAFDWQGATDHLEEVGTEESFRLSLALCRAGLMAGPSSGFTLAGLLKYLSKNNFTKETVAVFVCPDSPLPYLDDYFTYLPESDFPPVENRHLLKQARSTPNQESKIPEISCETLLIHLQGSNKDLTVIDMRDVEDFEAFHIPQAKNIPGGILKNTKRYKNKHVVFLCEYGAKSRVAAARAILQGIHATSLIGGITEWSRLNLPREKAAICKTEE